MYRIFREPGSALTHLFAMLAAMTMMIPLLAKTAFPSPAFTAMLIFMSGMILLYGASAIYHSVNVSAGTLRVFRRVDHAMIFVLIACSYTPVCLLVLEAHSGYMLLLLIWSLAAVGILMKMLWIDCPKWLSSAIYIAMGWACVCVMGKLMAALSPAAFGWLLAGGVIYTIGGVIYAMKLQVFNARHAAFGSHEIFHLFVMGGSLCHYIFMYFFAV